jgi:hypothetical protein
MTDNAGASTGASAVSREQQHTLLQHIDLPQRPMALLR